MHKAFTGTGVALVTPFDETGAIDFPALGQLIDHVITNRVEYVVSLGTTGESPVLSPAEKKEILAFTKKTVDQRVPIVAGFGGNHTQGIIDSLRNADLDGIDAILSVSPYYNKPSQEGLYRHYQAIAEASPLPIILYNVPGRTSSNITAATTLRLAADCPNILAIKEASGDLVQCMEIVNNKPREDFLVISGEDALSLPMMSFGMDGVISVIANAYPKSFAEMIRLARKSQMEDAAKLHYRLLDMINLIFKEGNPSGIKALLQILGLTKDHLRLPLAGISEQLRTEIRRAAEGIKE